MNLYGYVGNNPIFWVDPYGLENYWRKFWDSRGRKGNAIIPQLKYSTERLAGQASSLVLSSGFIEGFFVKPHQDAVRALIDQKLKERLELCRKKYSDNKECYKKCVVEENAWWDKDQWGYMDSYAANGTFLNNPLLIKLTTITPEGVIDILEHRQQSPTNR